MRNKDTLCRCFSEFQPRIMKKYGLIASCYTAPPTVRSWYDWRHIGSGKTYWHGREDKLVVGRHIGTIGKTYWNGKTYSHDREDIFAQKARDDILAREDILAHNIRSRLASKDQYLNLVEFYNSFKSQQTIIFENCITSSF